MKRSPLGSGERQLLLTAFLNTTLTIRLPDDKHARLRQLAKHRDLSVNKLMEELATISLAEYDAENRFRALPARGGRLPDWPCSTNWTPLSG